MMTGELNKKDLTGQRFGRLIVIMDTNKRTRCRKVIWLCRCDCGNLTEASGNHLICGRTKSCGCLQKEIASKRLYKHGEKNEYYETRLHRIWRGIKSRCLNQNSINYHSYGRRGIKIYPEWKNNYIAFKKWALANGYQSHLTIDRINHRGDYEPNNCQWITKSENSKKSHRESPRNVSNRKRGEDGRFL